MRKEKKRFRLVKYRLKVGNPRILLVQCWFEGNEKGDCELLFLVGDRRLKPKVSVKEGVEIRRKHLLDSDEIDKEYFYWVPLPEDMKNKQYLRIFEKTDGGERLVYAIPCARIIGLKDTIEGKFNEPVVSENKIIIGGWYVSVNPHVEIDVEGKHDRNIDFRLKEIYRNNAISEYPETGQENIHGFEIELDQPSEKSIKILLKDGAKISEWQCELRTSRIKKGMYEVKNVGKKSVLYFKKNGLGKTIKRIVVKILKIDENNYREWFQRNQPKPEELEEQKNTRFEYQPVISIVVPTYKTPLHFLREMIDSVRGQSYQRWELCIADGSEGDLAVEKELKKYAELDSRIVYRILEKNEGISGNTNQALELATGEYVGLFDHDDILAPNALFEVVKALQEKEYDILYTDEDKISGDKKEHNDPNFKPDFSMDLFCSHNYITHFFVVKRSIIQKIGGFRAEYDGSQDYDLMFRCIEEAEHIRHIPKILYHWRVHMNSVAGDPTSKMYAYEAGKKAIEDHFKRVGIEASVEHTGLWGMYHVKYGTPGNPLVSIIIPNKDHIKDLDQCIQSIYQKSSYKEFEIIIVENNSEKEETFHYYEKIQSIYSDLRVVKWEGKFNFSAINNFGVQFANGEYLLFLNNDTEMINETALEELVGVCIRDEVGAVGAKLLYADDTVQHAGVVIGFGGYAGHVHVGIGRYDYGYMVRARINCNYSAVTAACMLTKRSVFEQVGGFDEQFEVACNDVDYCLKLREIDKLIVYNAFSEWYHYESKTRGYEDEPEKVMRFKNEVKKFQKKWPGILEKGDPYYNPNFPVTQAPFTLG